MLYWYMNRSYITCWNIGSSIWNTDIWTDDNTLKYGEQLGAAITNRHWHVRKVSLSQFEYTFVYIIMEWRTSYYTQNILDKSWKVLCTYVDIKHWLFNIWFHGISLSFRTMCLCQLVIFLMVQKYCKKWH